MSTVNIEFEQDADHVTYDIYNIITMLRCKNK